MEALEARWLSELFYVTKEIQIIQFHQGVNLHIFNFSHKYWTSRPWGTADHRIWTWRNGANQAEERIHGWCLRCRTPRTRSFFPTSTLCLPRPEFIGLSTPDPVPSEPPWVLLSSTHVTSSSSSLWLGVSKTRNCFDTISPTGRTSARWCDAWLVVAFFQPAKQIRETFVEINLEDIDWKEDFQIQKCDCNNCRKCFRISSNLHCCSKNSHFRG